jgi:hypothetical protein
MAVLSYNNGDDIAGSDGLAPLGTTAWTAALAAIGAATRALDIEQHLGDASRNSE